MTDPRMVPATPASLVRDLGHLRHIARNLRGAVGSTVERTKQGYVSQRLGR
jgi:hypothetical protein